MFYAMCIIVIALNLVAFLHSGLVTIRDTEAIIRPQTTNFSRSSTTTGRLLSFFSSGQEDERNYSGSLLGDRTKSRSINTTPVPSNSNAPPMSGGGMSSSQSHRSLRSAMERGSIFSSSDRLNDLDRLDRERYCCVVSSAMIHSDCSLLWMCVVSAAWMTSPWWKN